MSSSCIVTNAPWLQTQLVHSATRPDWFVLCSYLIYNVVYVFGALVI